MWSDIEWETFIKSIRDGDVIPVVGQDLITVPSDDAGGASIPLNRHLARPLAEKVLPQQAGVVIPAPAPGSASLQTVNEVAAFFIQSGGDRSKLYYRMTELLRSPDALNWPVPSSLAKLAAITEFNLFVSLTFDDLLVRAIREARVHCKLEPDRIYSFMPKKPFIYEDKPSAPCLVHLLGHHSNGANYAMWDEDYLDYILGLFGATVTLDPFFEKLRDKNLLFLGAGLQDWVTRFLLRVARRDALTKTRDRSWCSLAENSTSPEMSLYFNSTSQCTQILPVKPADFIDELSRRYHAQGESTGIAGKMVFISYCRADEAEAKFLRAQLKSLGLNVWMDLDSLTPGSDLKGELNEQIKRCSLFVSVISGNTEGIRKGYIIRERKQAADILREISDAHRFYIGVIIDPAVKEPQNEPQGTRGLLWIRASGGQLTPDDQKKIQSYYNEDGHA